ncbi:MAG: hypothetical protein WCO21_01950 [bacterium]|nr:hypothetical protein [Candidatus Jorgensenbacteria bacterium]
MAKNSIHNYVSKIRNSDEKIKNRFVAIASAITMIGIIFVWLMYLNITIPSISAENKSAEEIPKIDFTGQVMNKPVDNSFFGIIKRGFSVMGQNIVGQFSALKNDASDSFSKIKGLASKKNESIIKPDNSAF